jgi:hypothetical protein
VCIINKRSRTLDLTLYLGSGLIHEKDAFKGDLEKVAMRSGILRFVDPKYLVSVTL